MFKWIKYILIFGFAFTLGMFFTDSNITSVNPVNCGDILQTAALIATLAAMVYSNNQQKEQFESQQALQQKQFAKQLQEQRQQWLNDGYRKAEIENWLEYRKQFYYLTYEFKWLLEKFTISGEKDCIKMKLDDLFLNAVELSKKHIFMKPYFDNENKLDFEKTQKFLDKLAFYFGFLEGKTKIEKDFDTGVRENLADESLDEFCSINKRLIRDANDIFELKLKFDPPNLKKSVDTVTKKFTEEIDAINSALEEITLPKELKK